MTAEEKAELRKRLEANAAYQADQFVYSHEAAYLLRLMEGEAESERCRAIVAGAKVEEGWVGREGESGYIAERARSTHDMNDAKVFIYKSPVEGKSIPVRRFTFTERVEE